MNISSMNSVSFKPQLPLQMTATKAIPTPAPDHKTVQEKKEAFAQAFYTKKEEPWRGTFYQYSDYTGTNETREMTKDQYIDSMKRKSELQLRILRSDHDKFQRNLMSIRPDLAQKNFSFTLGDDAELMILDPNGTLSPGEKNLLTDTLNTKTDIKGIVQTHAKIMMTLVDHDTKTFQGQYKLSLLNIHNVIDYGKVIESRKNDMNEGWTGQIRQNLKEENSSLIDTTA